MMHSTFSKPSRGGAPVGVLSELPAVELAAIIYLRLWFSGEQERVWSDFSSYFNRADAAVAMGSFEELMRTVQNHARRPLMRHSPQCECYGGDECAFAHFVAAATSGQEHDAMTFALHLFDNVQAKCVLGAAAMCGHAFYSIANGGKEFTQNPTHRTPAVKQ
jgi:hypothetical protein